MNLVLNKNWCVWWLFKIRLRYVCATPGQNLLYLCWNKFLLLLLQSLILCYLLRANWASTVAYICMCCCLSAGVIKTALPNMDREAKDQYLLVIQAKDMVGQNGGLSGTTSVTVTLTDVNDNPPRFPRSKLLWKYMTCNIIPRHCYFLYTLCYF